MHGLIHLCELNSESWRGNYHYMPTTYGDMLGKLFAKSIPAAVCTSTSDDNDKKKEQKYPTKK